MKKYLITSEYSYYDSYDFQTVCVCDTLEKAEQLVTQFEKQKEEYLNDIYYKVTYKEPFPENYLGEVTIAFHSNRYYFYIKEKDFDEYYHQINKIKYSKSNYLNLIYFGIVEVDPLIKRFYNEEGAEIKITEVDYFQ